MRFNNEGFILETCSLLSLLLVVLHGCCASHCRFRSPDRLERYASLGKTSFLHASRKIRYVDQLVSVETPCGLVASIAADFSSGCVCVRALDDLDMRLRVMRGWTENRNLNSYRLVSGSRAAILGVFRVNSIKFCSPCRINISDLSDSFPLT